MENGKLQALPALCNRMVGTKGPVAPSCHDCHKAGGWHLPIEQSAVSNGFNNLEFPLSALKALKALKVLKAIKSLSYP